MFLIYHIIRSLYAYKFYPYSYDAFNEGFIINLIRSHFMS
jgi:hypothetical protein